MNRLYAFETMPTSTGSRADHRIALGPRAIEQAARALAAAVGARGAGAAAGLGAAAGKAVAAIAKDLQAHRGSSLIVAGDAQPPAVHALAHAMNEALGNAGRTVTYTNTAEAAPIDQMQSLRDLVADMNAGRVDLLVIVGGNPVYTAPADLNVADAMAKVATRVHLSLYDDETSALCHWQIPEAHYLEAWGDARAYDGTVSIVQPLIAPLYGGRSAHELLAAMSDRPERTGHDVVREYWQRQRGGGAAFDQEWRRWLHDGVVPESAWPARTPSVRANAIPPPAASPASTENGFEVCFRHDPSILDGRFANNGWLQELPKPISRLTWDNAVFMSPATAERLKFENTPSWQGGEHGQILATVVELRQRGRAVRGAVFPIAGHPDNCVTLHLGYGRTRAGHVGTRAGFDANGLRTSDAPWAADGVAITATSETFSLACTQAHHLMEGRGMVRAVTREEFTRNPKSVHEGHEDPPRSLTLYSDYKYDGYKWGMSIDVNACIGCNACVVGCQSENNIAVIGKDQVLRGREMHWIRVDSYYRGPAEQPETYFQPVPCMQCENAPCEPVCPVGATVHSHEGLNDMVYNRCVGTRYCSNNCPYKVRRFNFLLYQDWETPSLKLMRNPDVTVRSRGVMEKCTYCVQRINAAKIDAEKENRRVADGDIKTACQQACPADAIVFGDLNDPKSRVAQLQAQERSYSLLAELNTRPRTTYMAAVRNVNPDLAE
jgi:molybdopterin-containing oxidoreductase family iron-sulfur binding subunit